MPEVLTDRSLRLNTALMVEVKKALPGADKITAMGEFVTALSVKDLSEGEARTVVIEGREIAVIKVADAIYALDNICPHRGGPIAEGEIQGEVVTCPWHAWSFNLRTGECTFNPAARLQKFEVLVEDGQIKIKI